MDDSRKATQYHPMSAEPRFERHDGSPRAVPASDPRQRSCRISTGMTRLARGINHPAIAHPGFSLGYTRPRASLFFAARNVQMMISTRITNERSSMIAAAAPTRSSASLALRTRSMLSPWSMISLRALMRAANATTPNTAAAAARARKTTSAVVRPCKLRHRLVTTSVGGGGAGNAVADRGGGGGAGGVGGAGGAAQRGAGGGGAEDPTTDGDPTTGEAAALGEG